MLYRYLAPPSRETFSYMAVNASNAYTSQDLVNWQVHSGQGGFKCIFGSGKWLIHGPTLTSAVNTSPEHPETSGATYRLFDGQTFSQHVFNVAGKNFWPASAVEYSDAHEKFFVIGKYTAGSWNAPTLDDIVFKLYSSTNGLDWVQVYSDVKKEDQFGYTSGRVYYGVFGQYNILPSGTGTSTPPITGYGVRYAPPMATWHDGGLSATVNVPQVQPYYTLNYTSYNELRAVENSTSSSIRNSIKGRVVKVGNYIYGAYGSNMYYTNIPSQYVWPRVVARPEDGTTSSQWDECIYPVRVGNNVVFAFNSPFGPAHKQTETGLSLAVNGYNTSPTSIVTTSYNGTAVVFGQYVFVHKADGVTYIVAGGINGKIYESMDDGETVTSLGRNLLPGGAVLHHFAYARK